MATKENASSEKADMVQALAHQREFLRHTARDLTDDQARQRTTVSELCIGGIVKHVSAVEATWADFIVRGPEAMFAFDQAGMEAHAATFRMLDDETIQGLIDAYEAVASNTESVVESLPSLDVSQPLPEAPWFEAGARWSARQALVHIVAETAQHCGHADIIRESLDGAKTMG